MATLYDLGQKIVAIREALDSLEVRGIRNASIIVKATTDCNEIIQMINDSTKKEDSTSDE